MSRNHRSEDRDAGPFGFLRSPRRTLGARALRRRIAAAPPGRVFLHLGCGGRALDGWINVDLCASREPGARPPDVLLDLSRGLPAPPASVDLIYTEDFVEHIDRDAGRRLFADCLAALRPGGTMRVLTPNLRKLVAAYLAREETFLAWYRENRGCRTFGDALNEGMRAWGHLYVYDDETLRGLLEGLGFVVEERAFGESPIAELAGLDSRNSGEGSLSIYFEATKRG